MKTNDDNEATRVITMDEATRLVNPGAPVSAEAMSKSPWASRLGFGIGGAALGFGAGFAASATAGTHETSVSGLAHAATPEEEMTPEQQADSVIHPREATTIDDPYDLPNSIEVKEEPEAIHVTAEDETGVAEVVPHPENEEISASVVAEPEVVADTIEVSVEDEITGTVPTEQEAIVVNVNDIHYAKVDDGMSFSEAFAAAREQVGAGGAFVWHGNTYGTYYAEEWNAMSIEERGQFLADVNAPDSYNHPVPVEPEVKVYDITYTLNSEGHLSGEAHISIDGTDVTLRDINGDEIMDVAIIEGENGNDSVLVLDQQDIDLNDVMNQMDITETDITDGPDMAATDVCDM